MIKSLPVLLLVFLASSLSAQFTLTADYFPVVGDTLKFTVADSAFAANVDLMVDGGENLDWYLGNAIGAGDFNEPVVAANDPDFPDATISIITNGVTESFYLASETSFDLVGVKTSFDLLPNFPISTPVTPVRPVRRAPLSFGATFSAVTENSVTLSPDSIPAEVLGEIGTALNNVDSLRITTVSTRSDEVDAYGTVRLGDNFYPVLREKRTEEVFIRLEVRTLPLNWIDVTGSITILNPQLADLLGQQPTTINYLFWAEDSKEPIVDVTTDAETGTVQRMTYKRAQTSTSTGGPGQRQAQVRVFPNPATALATFEIEGLSPGNYTLQLVDMVGRRMATREFSPLGDQTRLNLDVSNLRAGIYLYTLRNERGRTITTKKLQVR